MLQMSETTMRVLKNFATINQGIVIAPGNKIKTFASSKNILGEFTSEEEFPVEFAIYDLNAFLGAISLFQSPQLDFATESVTISEGKTYLQYVFADPSIIISPQKEFKFPKTDLTFDVTKEIFAKTVKAAQVLGLDNLVIESDGKILKLVVVSQENPDSNAYSIEIGEGNGKTFRHSFMVEYLKVIPGSYTVSISDSKVSAWESRDLPVKYYITLEKD